MQLFLPAEISFRAKFPRLDLPRALVLAEVPQDSARKLIVLER